MGERACHGEPRLCDADTRRLRNPPRSSGGQLRSRADSGSSPGPRSVAPTHVVGARHAKNRAMTATQISTAVRSFGELSRADVPFAGGKGANLGELTRAGLPVP